MSDAKQRRQALDVADSYVVQAPAGSGKTELLIQRFLALLGQVERPQQVLAITFTNKAAAEMRQRVIAALEQALTAAVPRQPHELTTFDLARAVVSRHGEALLRNPNQLAIQTIDSFNATLVAKMPWLSRFGQVPVISEEPETLYRAAVHNLFSDLGRSEQGSDNLQRVLRHLDNQVVAFENMLVRMLQHRDQWLGILLPQNGKIGSALQQSLESYCCDSLRRLSASVPPALGSEVGACGRFAAGQLPDSPLSALRDLSGLPGVGYSDLPSWQALGTMLLTSDGKVRKTVTKNQGFPPGPRFQTMKKRMLELLDKLTAEPAFARQLAAIRDWPGSGYGAEQEVVLTSLLQLLPRLVAELWLVFRDRGEVDFVEVALKANQALGGSDRPSRLLLSIDQDLRHVLVDEFQDTSRLQYRLLHLLTSGWVPGDGRTLFLVGDPMQSIYRFREAEVGLFLRSFTGKFSDHLRVTPLRLTRNFRSQEGLVAWVNQAFSRVFPDQVDEFAGAVPFAAATAVKTAFPGPACGVFPFVGRDDRAEAEAVVETIRNIRSTDPDQTMAILVRSRTHLTEILPLLRQQGIGYRAQDIDPLATRPAAMDVMHLTRALLHRGDRLSWLVVLRAPWCGLSLADLHKLKGPDAEPCVPARLAQQQEWPDLSTDGRRRLSRVGTVLQRCLKQRGRLPLRTLVEGCWSALGGPACYPPAGVADALRVFDYLETLEQGADLPSFERLQNGLKKIFAEPDPDCDDSLQIMTIHKAKGLEFDHVLIPGLGKKPKPGNAPLLRWLDHPEHGLLMAPPTAKGEQEKDPLYHLLGRLEREKDDYESSRLFYVAATRAKRQLYLFGHLEEDRQGEANPQKGSLLEKIWPALGGEFKRQGRPVRAVGSSWEKPLLNRLPGAWSLPPLALTAMSHPDGKRDIVTPSQSRPEQVFSAWIDPVHRHVGSAVHLQLEHLARHGEQFWLARSGVQRRSDMRRLLRRLGVRQDALDAAAATVCAAVDTCLASERGQWILRAHAGHRCELPLSGVVDGQVVHAVIDRTFVDAGCRWIIDYKTSTPQEGEKTAVFFNREVEQYEKQLGLYAQLFELSGEGLPVKTALYFPLIDGWCEIER